MKAALGSLAFYLAAVVWLTWPLGIHLATHLPATRATWQFDGLYGLWALTHEIHALLTDPARLPDGNIFHPARRALFYGPTALGALPFFAPTFLATGNPTLAMGMTFLAGLALTAWTLHLVVQRWSGSHLAGVVAAAVWLTTPYVMWVWIPTTPYHALIPYLPLIAFLAATRLASVRSRVALGALVVLQSLTDVVYFAPAVFAPLAVLTLARLARHDTRRAGLWLLAILVPAALLLMPLVQQYLAVRADNPDLAQQTVWTQGPLPLRLPLGLLEPRSAVGVAVAALALIAAGWLVARRDPATPRTAWAHAALWAAVGTFISLTPAVLVAGREITLPHYLLAGWAGVHSPVRVPLRLGVAGLIGLCLLAGLGFAACARRLRAAGAGGVAPLVALALVAAMYGEYVYGLPPGLGRDPVPARYPIGAVRPPPARLMQVAAEHGGPLIELPIGGWVGPVDHARAMYHAIFHRLPILNGYSSYWPAGFRERMVVASALPAPSAVAALRRQAGLALILVPLDRVPAYRHRPWLALAETPRADLRLLAREDDVLLFAVTP